MTVAEPKSMVELNELLKSAGSTLVVIDFHAAWCGPCRLMGPKFEKMAAEFEGVIFVKVDIDEQREAATLYEIEVMPTFVFIKEEKQIDVVKGKNEEMLRSAIATHK